MAQDGILLRITGIAYSDYLERIAVTDHVTIRVELTPVQSRSEVAGTYTLTVSADPACASALSPAARQRTYTAIVRQTGSEVSVRLETGSFIIRGRSYNRFEGRLDGSNKEIVFNLSGFGTNYYDAAYYPDVAEELGISLAGVRVPDLQGAAHPDPFVAARPQRDQA